MKIAIVSTAYPLRGGIAQYTGILYKKLAERGHQVNVITFKRQYPNLLFPGKTQMEISTDPSLRIPSEPILDSIGPFSWWRVGKRLKELQPDLVVFKFWMPFFAPAFGFICKLARKLSQARILYICDNVIPHEKRPGDIKLTRFAFKHADAFIVQSGVVEKDLLSLVPNARYRMIPHPLYDIFGQAVDKMAARATLNLTDERIVLFFGYVRAYKGLDLMLRALPVILKQVRIKLLVVGEFYEDESKYRDLAASLGVTDSIQIHSDFVPNAEVSSYFSAADVVALPYTSATQSGIVQLAYHLDRPCIVTDVGGLAEVVVHEKTGFVVPPRDPGALAAALVRFYQENRAHEFSENVMIEKKKYSWEAMIDGVEWAASGRSGRNVPPPDGNSQSGA